MRTPIVVGNWKMHGSFSENETRIEQFIGVVNSISEVDCSICVPYPFLGQVGSIVQSSRLGLGAQNVNENEFGAYTGEVSAKMLKDLNCEHVIVGHSERRKYYLENDILAGKKAVVLLTSGLTPIICIGESLEQRREGRTVEVIGSQLDVLIRELGVERFRKVLIAYEPLWAIGTGETASPEQVQEVHHFIREKVGLLNESVAEALRIIYGGSVKSENASNLFRMTDVDGGLVGGASLDGEEFKNIFIAAKL